MIRFSFLLRIQRMRFSEGTPGLAIAFSAAPDDRLFDVVFLSEQERPHMLDWLAGHPDQTPPPVAMHKGRRISIKWTGRPLRVDDRVYFHPETASRVKIGFLSKSLKILVPALQGTI